MKKITYVLLIYCLLGATSCATILGGKVTEYQRQQQINEKPRQIRTGYLIANLVLFTPILGAVTTYIDFNTGAIFKPIEKKESKQKGN